MKEKLPFAHLSQQQMDKLADAEKTINSQLDGDGEIILLAYKNE